MYSSKVIEIFKNLTNAGGLQGANGVGKYIDESCGDYLKIYLKINDKGIIEEARFKTMGSTASIVSSSVICKLAVGLDINKALKINAGNILEELQEVPNDKLYTLDFAVKCLRLAIEDYFEKQEKEAKKQGKEYIRIQPENAFEEDEGIEEEAEEIFEEYEEAENIVEEKIETKTQEQTPILSKQELHSAIEAIFSKKDDIAQKQEEIFEDEYEEYFENFLMDVEQVEEISKPTKKEKSQEKNSEEQQLIEQMEQSNKATKLIEEAKNYTPIVETKIVTDADLKNFGTNKNNSNNKTKSNAKAIFDSLFDI